MREEKENPLTEAEQAKEIGHQAERKIIGGEEIFISEEDRVVIKEMLKQRGVNLSFLDQEYCDYTDGEELKYAYKQHCDQGFKDEDHLSMWVAQTYFLAAVLKPEKFVSLVSNVVAEISEDHDKEEARLFVAEFFTNQLNNKSRIRYNSDRAYRNGKSGKAKLSKLEEKESEWKVEAMNKAVAVISGTYRWCEVINSGMEAEAIVRQGDYVVYRDLRERTIRGVEQKRQVDLRVIKRVEDIEVEGIKKFREGREIMSLPLGTQGLILKNMVG